MSLKTFQKLNKLKPDGILGPLTMTVFKKKYGLNNIQTAHFFGQIAHETAVFRYSQENLNYSERGLRKVFTKYFPTIELAREYARKPIKIANRVYANRMGNRGENSGDGWKYRGRGAIQLTGFNNYKGFSEYISDVRVLLDPNIVASKYYLESALYFFKRYNLFDNLKDVRYNTIRKLTRKINGGYNGLQHRYDLTLKYYKLLNKYDNEMGNRQQNS